ncbi:unnamed protein product [Coffea canephora]|uniref:NB-ARC domain-containing protein n=1 Tax=Coffea canephora TaxID=49390 RepID=A0A068UXF2_COFCA|nr:unnamed protein product [Coffea canephora]
MKAFLKVAEAKEDDDPRYGWLQEWIKQVREAAYDIEDVLDEFVLRFAGYRHHGFYLIRQLNKDLDKSVPQLIESMTTAELKEFVKDFLRRAGRYAIVFDDVWDVEFWNEIKFALPEGNYGNRVMLTTRNADVAPASCTKSQDYVYKMEPLSIEDSWTLFCNKIFKRNRCPAHLTDVAKAILDNVRGCLWRLLRSVGSWLQRTRAE